MKLVVATSPEIGNDGRFLEHDLQFVRSALLYADTVELLSPVTPFVASLANLHSRGPDAWMSVLATLDDHTLETLGVLKVDLDEFKSLARNYEAFRAMPRFERRRRRAIETAARSLRQVLAESTSGSDGLQARLAALLDRSGAQELSEAVEAGVVTMNWDFMPNDGDTSVMVDKYADHLKSLLESVDVHLLLDASMASMAAAMIREGHAAPPELTLDRATRSQVGAGLVARLPAFPDATISSILETRADLAEPLSHYRHGVTSLSRRLASGHFTPEVRAEITDLWRDEVEPSVTRLKHDLSRTRLAREATRNAVGDSMTMLGAGGFYFGLETFTKLDHFATAAMASAPVLGKAVVSALRDSEQRRQNARDHEFFYLLKLGERL